MNKKTLGIGLGISMIMAVALNFVSSDASAFQPGTISCSTTFDPSPNQTQTFINCTTCKTVLGIGYGGGTCRYIQE